MSASNEPTVEAAQSAPEPLRDDLIRRLDQRVAEEQVTGRLPTLMVGVVRDGVLIWWKAKGATGLLGVEQSTPTTQYRIGSISKTFVAASVLRLRDEGTLDLADRIGEHLPELSELPITIAQLLSHTSGLRAETPAPWWERTPGISFDELVASTIRPVDLLWRPGRRFHYSNPGYAILGELIARLRSAPFGEVIRDELLVPLGMRRTTLRPVPPFAQGLAVHPHADLVFREPEHDAGTMSPAGQLWSTIGDLAHWSEVLAGHRPALLSAESVAEMTEPIGLMDLPGQSWTTAYGLGLMLQNQGGRLRYGHTGGMPGHLAILLIDKTTKDVVIGLANSTYRGLRFGFFEEVLSLLDSEQPRRRTPFGPRAAGCDERQRELLGTWYWGPVEYRLDSCPDGHIQLKGVPTGRDCSFRPRPDGTYVGESGYFAGETLEPRRRDDGSVSHLDIASFIFTRLPYDPRVEIPGGLDDRGWQAE